jgi:hypothetical protein
MSGMSGKSALLLAAFQRVGQPKQHLPDSLAQCPWRLDLCLVHIFPPNRDQQESLDFAERSSRDREKPHVISTMFPPIPFCNVAGHGNRCSLNLARQTEPFLRGKPFRKLVHGVDQIHAPLPDVEVSVVLQRHTPPGASFRLSDTRTPIPDTRYPIPGHVIFAIASSISLMRNGRP